MAPTRAPHPVVWSILYFPFGALSGFVSVALTFLATRHGMSIGEGAMLNGANLLSQWLKWSWAPIVDVTWTPKGWYWFATAVSALGVLAMSAIPMSPATLPLLLGVIAVASLINSIVGMSIEAILAAVTTREEQGRVSAWFQAGNLGGAGIGGGLGLILLQHLPSPWMAGAILGALFLACGAALAFVPDARGHAPVHGVVEAVRTVFTDVRALANTKGGLLAAVLCFLPVGTGAAQGVLTQAEVAARWGAGDTEVAWLQGFAAGGVTVAGCFAGGWLADRLGPRPAYVAIGLALAVIAVGLGLGPATVTAYVVGNLVYAFAVGLAYAAFTAVVLEAIGAGSAATKYNLYASLANFPIWWLGLVLGQVAEKYGPDGMLEAEAALGVVGVGVFAVATWVVRRTALPDVLVEVREGT